MNAIRSHLRTFGALCATAGRLMLEAVDLRDTLFVVGVTLGWYGGARVNWPWSCVAVGALLVVVALFGVRPTGGSE